MANVKKLTEEQLDTRIRKLARRSMAARWAVALCLAAGFIGSSVIPVALLGLSTLAAAAAAVVDLHGACARGCCQDELAERAKQRARTVPAPEPVKQAEASPAGPSTIFNPVAATILDQDMQAMAPLRLKKRVAGLMHG